MAAVTTPEHVEAHTTPVVEKPMRVEVRKVAIDGNTLSVLAVGVALFALAFGAFTHLSGRIGSVATELRTDIKDVNAKLEKLDVKLSGRMDGFDAKLEKLDAKLSGRMDGLEAKLGGRVDGLEAKLSGRVDGLEAKIEKLSTEQRAESREINARLDRLFELVASQGRRDP